MNKKYLVACYGVFDVDFMERRIMQRRNGGKI